MVSGNWICYFVFILLEFLSLSNYYRVTSFEWVEKPSLKAVNLQTKSETKSEKRNEKRSEMRLTWSFFLFLLLLSGVVLLVFITNCIMNSIQEMENEKTKATTILPVNTSWSLELFRYRYIEPGVWKFFLHISNWPRSRILSLQVRHWTRIHCF